MMANSQRTPQNGSQGSPNTPAPYVGASRSRTETLELRSDGKPRFQGCSSIKAYEIMDKLGEGTFGEVYRARHRAEGSLFALKKILMHNEKDGFPITALREIRLLKLLSHPNVLQLREMVVEHASRSGKMKSIMYMVMPYMNHDLSGLLENPKVSISEAVVKCYMLQLLKGVQYLHATKILHRDMKAANLLISNRGILQIADFGLARQYDEDPPVPGQGGGEANREYTHLVVTRWYRPPELLLSLRRYTTAIDMWGVGCILGEMFKHKPILAGSSDLKQAQMIFDLVGSPTEENMPGWSALPGCEGVKDFQFRRGNIDTTFGQYSTRPEFLDLMKKFLLLDWRKRVTAVDALEHPYFRVAPLPVRPHEVPQFEESHELDRRKGKETAALPPAPAGGTVGMGHPQGEWGYPQNGGHNRRAPGPPPNGGHYNHGARGLPNGNGGERRRAWDDRGDSRGDNRRDHRRDNRDNRGGMPGAPNTALPAKPPPSNDGGGWPAGGGYHQNMPVGRQPHGREPRGRGPPDGGSGDVYIPSYGQDEGARRRDPGRRPIDDNPRLDYDGSNERRDDRNRDRDRDWDRDRGHDRDRDRDRDRAPRNRSRSPGRRPPDDRNRDRGVYSRR